MQMRQMKFRAGMLAAAAAFALGTVGLGASSATLTGTVSDSMCGAKHMMKDGAACARACVNKGADYALVVKDKVYTLKADDALKAELAKLAGKSATVAGDEDGTTITVSSVIAAK